MTHTIQDKNSVISSITLDQIIAHIWDADAQGVLKLPKKLDRPASYGVILTEMFYPEDLTYLEAYINDLGLGPQQLLALDALTRWSFVNAVSRVRCTLGMIGAVIAPKVALLNVQTHPTARPVACINTRFTGESVALISQVLREASASPSACAKIPKWHYEDEYEKLSSLNEIDRKHGLVDERRQLVEWMKSTDIKTELYPEAGTRTEYAARRLIQVIQAIAGYKNSSESDTLRTLVSNVNHISTLVRVQSSQDSPLLSRLASDVIDYFHSLDRMLSANCAQARAVLSRMKTGDLLYDECLALGRQRHQVMALEFSPAVTLFSYMLKVAAVQLKHDAALDHALDALMRFTNAEAVYRTTLDQFAEPLPKKTLVLAS